MLTSFPHPPWGAKNPPIFFEEFQHFDWSCSVNVDAQAQKRQGEFTSVEEP